MGNKGKWFRAVKKVFSPDSKERKANKRKSAKSTSIEQYSAPSNSETGNELLVSPPHLPVVDVPEEAMDKNPVEDNFPMCIIDDDAPPTEVTIEVAPTMSKFDGKSEEEVAAIMIQTAFRAYQARKGLRSMKGLARLKSLVDGDAAKRQVTTSLRCMQALSRVQSQIQSRRIRLTEEKQALQRLKREQEQEALKASMGDEWDDSQLTKQQLDASLMSRHEAAMRRERAMAYSFTHQRKNTLKSGYPLFTDLNNPHWEWSCLDRLTTSKSKESAIAPEKEASSNDQTSDKNAIGVTGVEITNAYAKRDSNAEKQSLGFAKPNRQLVRPASTSPTTKVVSVAKSPKPEALNQKVGKFASEDDDSRSLFSIQSETNRRHTLPNLNHRDDETHTSRPSTPNFMNPTKSARAKSKLQSPSNEIESIDKASNNSSKKRLSLSSIDKHSTPYSTRRHSGPPKVSVVSVKVAHSDYTPDASERT